MTNLATLGDISEDERMHRRRRRPFVGTPLDDLRPLAYTLWKTDFLSQATSRDLAEFYSTKDYVPQGNRIDALNISKMYLELDQVEHSEL
ncbi:hypothetical protein DYB31_011264, partial [Aphanomyces astaci]